ncbi:uncharacterized protein LOC123534367 [Mercenaria mercenaria]|uniref:uncharacterized protein LOC123534367 n=1 Tax=Mercenaria mercenaria TaxID=6596 RepID=UPI00234EF1C1|nr:uncharacterized protein LOC123534367 [Mercenaria mercenaria]
MKSTRQETVLFLSMFQCIVITALYLFMCSRNGNKMADKGDNEAIRTAAAVGTSPLWVPAAAAGGLVYGAGKGLDEANDFGKKHGPLAGIAATPFIVVGNILAGPFRGIKRVGDAMVGKDN